MNQSQCWKKKNWRKHEFRNYSKAKIHKAQLLLNKQSDTFFLFQNLRPLKKYNQKVEFYKSLRQVLF